MCDDKVRNINILLVYITLLYIKTHGSESRGQEEAGLRDERVKTHGSESRGQEEAGLRDERVSYLQVAPP